MGSTLYVHTGDKGKVDWHRLAGDSGLGADVFEGENRHPDNVGIFCTPDVLADLVVKLTTWPDVMAKVTRASILAAHDGADGHEVDDLDAVAVDYFRRGFALFGEQASHYAVKEVDNG